MRPRTGKKKTGSCPENEEKVARFMEGMTVPADLL